MFKNGQFRETLEEANYSLIKRIDAETVLLLNNNVTKHLGSNLPEIWIRHDHFSGYSIEIEGIGYEFVSSDVNYVEYKESVK